MTNPKEDPFEVIRLRHETLRRLDTLKLENMDLVAKLENAEILIAELRAILQDNKIKIETDAYRIKLLETSKAHADDRADSFEKMFRRLAAART